MASLRISEAQILYETVHNATFRMCAQEFFLSQYEEHIDMLLRQIRQPVRDTMKEAQLAGKIDAYETAFSELEYFAQRMLKEATE